MSRKGKTRRKRGISLPGGSIAPAAPAAGRPPKEDATRVAIDARIRHHNATVTEAKDRKDPSKPEDRKAMADPIHESAIGRIIAAMPDPDQRADLASAVDHMARVYARYSAVKGYPSPHAAVAHALAPTDTMETSADHPAPDLRPLEERVRSATGAYMAVEGWLGYTDKHAASCARQAAIYDPHGAIRDLPAVIRALLCVVDGIKGNRMMWRGAAKG